MEQAPTQPNTTTKKTVLPDTAPKKPDPAPKEDAVRAFSHPPVDRMAPGPICASVRRGGRAVECTGLENRQGFAPFVGSNPTLSAIRFQGFQWVTAKCLSLCLSLLFSVYKLQTLLAESIAKKATDHDVKHVVKPSRRVFIEKYKTVLHILKLSRQKAWKRSHFVN